MAFTKRKKHPELFRPSAECADKKMGGACFHANEKAEPVIVTAAPPKVAKKKAKAKSKR